MPGFAYSGYNTSSLVSLVDTGSVAITSGSIYFTTGTIYMETGSVLLGDPVNITGTVAVANAVTVTGTVSSEPVAVVTYNESNVIDGQYTEGQNYPISLTRFGDLRVRSVFEPHVSDAFSRLRVANTTLVFQGKPLYFDRKLEFVEQTLGGATSSWGPYEPIKHLNIPDGVTGSAIRQSRWFPAYEAGKSHQILMTFCMGAPVTGAIQRVGYFDQNDGIFLEQTVTGAAWVIRNNSSGTPVDTNRVTQGEWNIDTMSGSGPSGRTLDFTKSQILAIDFEWLGVGNVRVGFVIGGKIYYVHQFTHANEKTGVYMASPSLPTRWEVTKTATSGNINLDAICCSVNSEGGSADVGWSTAVDRGSSTFSYALALGTTIRPLLSVRTSTSASHMTAKPENISVVCTTTATRGFRWVLLLNPTINGGAAANWISSSVNTGLQYDISQTGEVSGGFPVASGYGTGDALSSLERNIQPLGTTVDGTRDIYVLAVQQLAASSGTPEEYVASMIWREIY